MSLPEGYLYRASTHLQQQLIIYSESIGEERMRLTKSAAKRIAEGMKQSRRELEKQLGYIATEEMAPVPISEYDEQEEMITPSPRIRLDRSRFGWGG